MIEKIEKTEKIKTWTLKHIPNVNKRKKKLAELLQGYTKENLRTLYSSLFGKPALGHTKAELFLEVAEALAFPDGATFRAWFFALPELTQELLYRTMFDDWIPAQHLEQELHVSLVQKDTRSSWRTEWQFRPEYKLNAISVYTQYNQAIIWLAPALRTALEFWFVPPALMTLEGCLAPEQEERIPWNNSVVIAETFPLLCDALRELKAQNPEADWDKTLRTGFKKRDLQALQDSSGFERFGQEDPHSVDLAARFIWCMLAGEPRRTEDGHEGVRSLVQGFFSNESQYPEQWHAPDRNYLEFTICLDHLSRNPGYYLNTMKTLPSSRKVFQEILLAIAQDGRPFDADKLAEYIRRTGKQFTFCDPGLERSLKMKAQALTLEGVTYTSEDYEEFHPEGILRYHLLVKPLFQAYCYCFATLGLLEITEKTPPLCRTYHDKHYPISPYDSLETIRITDLGRWCLGLTEQRPPRPARECQAIADKELYLVTVKGNSLERQLYLNKIGQKLGADRWRISPGSFINGCNRKEQIEERIRRFKGLLDPQPAAHWERLFEKVLARAGLFQTLREDLVVYELPEDRETVEELLRDPDLKRIVFRAEGKLLIVPAKNQQKFFSRLQEHGIASVSP